MTHPCSSLPYRLRAAGLLLQLTAVGACTGMLGIDDDYVEAYPTTSSDSAQLSDTPEAVDAGDINAESKPDAGDDANPHFSCPGETGDMVAVYGETSSWCIDTFEVTQGQYDTFLEGPAEGCSAATNLDSATTTDPLDPVIAGKGAANCYCQAAGKSLCKHPSEEGGIACLAAEADRGMLDGAPEWVSASFEFDATCLFSPWNCDQVFLRHTGADCASTTAAGRLSSKPQAQIRCCADIGAE